MHAIRPPALPGLRKMALRARQEQQLHLAIALYLESKFPEAHRAFEKEAHIDVSRIKTGRPFSFGYWKPRSCRVLVLWFI